jgi:hypothetical protein
MEQSLGSIDPALLALIHGSFAKGGHLQPFVQETMLIHCEIAGTGYRDLSGVEPGLEIGSLLPLKREPSNPHDKLTIMIFDAAGHHLGYVPRAKNEVLARLMDAGKLLFGKLEQKEWTGDWLTARVRIFMRDF